MSIIVVLAVTLFLLMFTGFGVDMTNLFFHRQTAQNAADSACVAAIMDMQRERVNGTCHTAAGVAYPCGNFTAGTAFNCAATPGAAPCKYAALNGYSGASAGIPAVGAESNSVQVSFPPRTPGIPGVPTPDLSIGGPYPFVQVDVFDGVRVYFASWLSGTSTQVVHALAKCGLQTAQQPIPILVLDPSEPKSFQIGGNPVVQIVGGPNRSIQVNSDASAAQASGNAAYLSANNQTQVDLTHAGIDYSGADFGVTGGPPPTPGGFSTNTPFGWRSGVAPVGDPFVNLPPPPDPKTPGTSSPVAYGVDGCPDSSPTRVPPGGTVAGCLEYTPGDYPNGIVVQGYTAIFNPGVYYISCNGNCNGASPGLAFKANGIVRPSTVGQAGGDDAGAIFYFTCGNPGSCTSKNEATIYVDANSGQCNSCSIDAFSTSRAHCANDTAWDARAGIPATVGGNVLLSQCTTLGAYPGGVMSGIGTDSVGPLRGILFFSDRSAGVQETMNGGGGLLLTGTMYFRDCPTLLTTGTCQAPPTDYQTITYLTGGSGSGTRVFGEIVTDQLTLQGTSGITMDLNPWSRPVLKVELLQ